MLGNALQKIFGSKNERELKKIQPVVEKTNSFEPDIKRLTDAELRAYTPKFKDRLAKGETLDDILPEAFAVVREVSKRRLNMRHFDVQLVGGIVLHHGKISEMKTGEGKTLVATLPLYLNALEGKGCHLITVNDYLAKRDTQWMGPIYHNLGLSVGVIQHDASFLYDPAYAGKDERLFHLRPCSRKEAYQADITYGTNNEFGFDYLRDNMKFSLDEYVQRELHYSIVDEVDSILIDEARTPLIISGLAEESTDKYYTIDRIIPGLKKDEHFTVDEKARQVILTEDGVEKVERLLNIENLYDPRHIETLHHVNQGLRAHVLFHKDVDYVVKDNEVIIVDEFTGRLMPGRRWSDGLHQAIEAKEKVKIENENQTLATITFQNYFRMYKKLSGMTGTADTEAAEFHAIYKLEVMVIPPNRPMRRGDHPDLIYKSEKEKFSAVIREITEWHENGRPVLVGTISIEKSEKLASLLSKHGIKHHVLNAKHHEKEAEIISQAGRIGAVTISTNMAGRGTDIVLGGNPEALAAQKAGKDDTTDAYKYALEAARQLCEDEKKKAIELGGLHIIGTERHESRRIDNQLRGRAGRQGDPGSSRFYLSLEDDLLRIFGSERISSIMDKLGMEEDVPIEHGLVTKAIENAQKKVEAHNFDIRKHLLEYDDVMNQQREVVYTYRRQILGQEGLRDMVFGFIEDMAEDIGLTYIDEKSHPEEWDKKTIKDAIYKQFDIQFNEAKFDEMQTRDSLIDTIIDESMNTYQKKVEFIGEEPFAHLEKVVLLHTLDTIWKDHLLGMDHLKEGIGLRGYGQKNPLHEYKREGFELFTDMIFRLKQEVTERLFKVQIAKEEGVASLEPAKRRQQFVLSRGEGPAGVRGLPPSVSIGGQGPASAGFKQGAGGKEQAEKPKPIHVEHKVGRNEPCPCGSGKKYKKCCGK
ncbi:MAG: preprotein translocase subunit SecA [Deltaproteobacteria bacterium GWC2_42_51]|nr:MAG: preprotein translocase subunit SecA [Deltaproteobacteria bacterium GWA2_42_85]OGP26182.1 MAG: preprotein translocase subunit SecA [Deltaproteobacteria bacterium GWB2_42_7]OGP35013.1 MAG: preprotein translocase subunit SecA [Deltaproteobacteria bacterium GWC2_42_51]OGP38578.1 MAG: preprotein translocase subunit SecA [Deltaproteobacteria bacterium GWD2_42_10]OGP48405.1 MAG: preprotein translocase subunit SecA [Deltaproteobacteria bacterium GWF2_42_12]OGQ24021.1 MAG: preprotein translocas